MRWYDELTTPQRLAVHTSAQMLRAQQYPNSTQVVTLELLVPPRWDEIQDSSMKNLLCRAYLELRELSL